MLFILKKYPYFVQNDNFTQVIVPVKIYTCMDIVIVSSYAGHGTTRRHITKSKITCNLLFSPIFVVDDSITYTRVIYIIYIMVLHKFIRFILFVYYILRPHMHWVQLNSYVRKKKTYVYTVVLTTRHMKYNKLHFATFRIRWSSI